MRQVRIKAMEEICIPSAEGEIAGKYYVPSARQGDGAVHRTVDDEANGRGNDGTNSKVNGSINAGTEAKESSPSKTETGPKAVLFLGGSFEGGDGPAGGLYAGLGDSLAAQGIASLHLTYRKPGELGPSLFDAMTGLSFLAAAGAASFGVVGYSFGGAVAAQAAARQPGCRLLVLLATQSQGVEAVAHLRDGCATLLLHGLADQNVPAGCSQYAHQLAPEPKKILLVPEEGHGLEGATQLAAAWINRWAGLYI
jgi:hypothetical protein